MLWAPESSSAEGGTSPSPVFHSKGRVRGSARTPMPSTPTGPPSSEAGLGSEAEAPHPGPACPSAPDLSRSVAFALSQYNTLRDLVGISRV